MKTIDQRNFDISIWKDHLSWLGLALLLLVAFMGIILVPSFLQVGSPRSVPYPLHSILQANYGVDTRGIQHAKVGLSVIAQVVQENYPTEVGGGVSEIESGLGTPVPTVTPRPEILTPVSGIPTPTRVAPTATTGSVNETAPVVTPAPTDLTNRTVTPGTETTSAPNETVEPEITPGPSHTPGGNEVTPTSSQVSVTQPAVTHPVFTPTATLNYNTPEPSNTSINPSRTPTPTSSPTTNSPTQTSYPTATPRPPTATPTHPPPPTNTPRPRPTNTPDPYPPPDPDDTPYP
jgi:hypothetical protein